VLGLVFTFTGIGSEAPKLLPFQGRLTDANGTVVPDGLMVVQFKLYDAPIGGQAVWSGEVQKLTVNGGLVSTLLGSKASMVAVDFNKSLYLELTIDANNDGQITGADPPMLPRQIILPAIFASETANSRELAGHDWSDLLVSGNDPSIGFLRGNKIQTASITGAQLTAGTITSNQIAPQTITGGLIASGTITSNQIGSETIDLANLTQSIAEALNPPGTVVAFAGDIGQVPRGWILCDGRPLSATTYSKLFVAISTNWGSGYTNNVKLGDFNVPDLRGMFLRGVTGLYTNALGDPDFASRTNLVPGGSSGNKVGSYQPSAFAAHFHGTAINTPGNFGQDVYGTGVRAWQTLPYPDSVIFGLTSGRTYAQNSESVGGSETRPKNAYVNYIIKY
jgi:hypothetical protein